MQIDIEQHIQNLLTDIINPGLEDYQTTITLIKVEPPEPIVIVAIEIESLDEIDKNTILNMVEVYLRDETNIDTLIVLDD